MLFLLCNKILIIIWVYPKKLLVMATEMRGFSGVVLTEGKKELEKDERINLRVIFPTIIAFLQKQWTAPLPDAYFNYLNTALG